MSQETGSLLWPIVKLGTWSAVSFGFNDPIYCSIQFVQHLNIYQTLVYLFVCLIGFHVCLPADDG